MSQQQDSKQSGKSSNPADPRQDDISLNRIPPIGPEDLTYQRFDGAVRRNKSNRRKNQVFPTSKEVEEDLTPPTITPEPKEEFTPSPEVEKTPSNPFIYSGTVAPENFWGRKTALDHIKNRIGAVQAQSVNIVGYRRQGKSSLLRYIKECPGEFFKREQKPAIVSLDLQDRRFHQPEGVTEGIRRGIKKVLGEELWRREDNGDPFAVEDGLENLREKGYRLILLLDEFEQVEVKLEEFQDWGDDFRAKASAGLLALVVATKRPIHEVYQGLNLTSPFGNIFSMTVLGALEKSAWQEGVKKGFEDRIEAEQLDWIEEVAGGLPFYTQMAASILWQHKDLDSAQQAMTEAVTPHFEYLWENLKDEERSVLKSLVGGIKDSGRILQQLERYGLVKQSGQKVFSSLFAEFVQDCR